MGNTTVKRINEHFIYQTMQGLGFFLYPAPINDFNVQKWAILPGLGKQGRRFILK